MTSLKPIESGISKTGLRDKKRYLVRVSRRLRTLDKTKRASRQAYAQNLIEARRLKLRLANLLNNLSPTGAYATFNEAVSEYLQYMKYRRQPSVLYREISSIKANLMPLLGSHLVREITAEECQQVLDLSSSGRSTQTYKHLRNYLRGILEHVKRRGWISVNPAENTENRPIKRKDPLILNESQVRKLLHHLKDTDPVMFYHVALAIYTCCRAGD